ncbi:hypothetical protein NLM27_27410 [Bradyrhizobium sp. CCGB12]|nr:hypothetical protein [Bradyrhizobium sp. CCGB12]MCP3392477.1 hypothetical protein [Bradyrhizobium sp. CCGB12]
MFAPSATKIEGVDDLQNVTLVDELVVYNSQIPDLTGNRDALKVPTK